jgi:lipopolysaccharide/colanic/teichoic acid biosynthesis glycosyltransferase
MATEQQLTTEPLIDVTSHVLVRHRRAPIGRSTIPTRRRPALARTRPCDQQSDRAHVVSEELFKGALVRERKCADRSDQPFVLVLVRPTGVQLETRAWDAVIATLAGARRETDLLGWFEQGVTLGAILPEVDLTAEAAREFEARVRQELTRRLDAATAARVSIELHVHVPMRGKEKGASPLDSAMPQLAARKSGGTLYDTVKRALDIAFSGILLLILSPLFLVIAALVKLKSPGPIFFKQVRIGEQAQPFTMLKFRTMHVNCDSAVHAEYVSWFIKSSGKDPAAGQSGVFKLANDKRITPIGGILRKTSLDELPQLWNVFRGDMSLVGPRPPLPYEVEQYRPWHCRRVLEAKPGITGLWQVTGRSRTTFDEMVRLDLRYAKTYSLWTDIRILLATPRAVITGKGAC